MKKKTIIKSMLVLMVAVCSLAVGIVSAYAYWSGTSTLSRESTLTIGQTETSITLGTPSGTNPVEWYQGTSATFEYTVDISGAEGDVKVKASVNTEAAADFSIQLFVSVDGIDWGAVLANDGTDVVVNTNKVKVVVTLTAASKPSYNSATLTVVLA